MALSIVNYQDITINEYSNVKIFYFIPCFQKSCRFLRVVKMWAFFIEQKDNILLTKRILFYQLFSQMDLETLQTGLVVR